MVDWTRVDGQAIPSGQAFAAGALASSGIGIGTITNVTPGDAQNTITFTAVAGATSYNIYWKTTSGVTKLNGTKITGVTSPHVHTGLTNGVEIFYVYTAQDAETESVESNEVSGTPNASPPNVTTLFFGIA